MKFWVVIIWLMISFILINVAFDCLTAANTVQNMGGILLIALICFASYEAWLGIKIVNYFRKKKKAA